MRRSTAASRTGFEPVPIFPALWLVAALALAAATAGPARAVVGPSEPGAPLAAGIVMVLNHSGRDAGFCTGIVVSPTAVMTAAHCAPPGADLRVHYPDQGQPPVLLPVAGVERHPGYRPDAIRTRQRSIDLALIRLASPLPARFTPVTLAEAAEVRPGQRFTLSGYGLGAEGVPASSGRLRSTTLAARPPVSPVLLWAGDPERKGAGACTGDSGAPLTREGEVSVAAMAVWSAGIGRHSCGDLTQALWIAPERGWIVDVLRQWQGAR